MWRRIEGSLLSNGQQMLILLWTALKALLPAFRETIYIGLF